MSLIYHTAPVRLISLCKKYWTHYNRYTFRWSRIKTGYLHIWDFYYIFINQKVIPIAITHRI